MKATMTLFTSSSKIINPNRVAARLFVGFDGRTYIADARGTHVASALAIALLEKPCRRIAGYRSEVANG